MELQTRTLVIVTLVISLITILSFSAPSGYAASAYVFDGNNPGALHQSTLDCASIGGSWANATSTCTLRNSGSLASAFVLTIAPGAQLVITFGAAFSVSGLVLISNGTIANTGTITITRSGTINNAGTLRNNYGSVFNYGTLANGPKSLLSNYGVIANNYGGILNNTGTVNNNGLIDDATGGTFNNGPKGVIANAGVIATECGGIINVSGPLSGNPVQNTCKSLVGSTSTVPEFSIGSFAIVAFTVMAIIASLTRRPFGPKNRSRGLEHLVAADRRDG